MKIKIMYILNIIYKIIYEEYWPYRYYFLILMLLFIKFT